MVDPIVVAAGTALVGAMATDAWQEARDAVVALWRRMRPEQAEVIDAELVETRDQILTLRQVPDEEDTERAIAASWQIRLQMLLREDPSAAEDLRRLLDGLSTPVSGNDERAHVGTLTMNAQASGSGRVYQAGRDQHIAE